MKLETKRLILRTAKNSDWKDVVEGIGDKKVSSMLAVVPYPYKKKDALEWISKNIKKSKKKIKNDVTLAIELKSERKVIGATGIHRIDRNNGKCETGSWLNKRYWRKGYILEAKVAVLDFIFNKLKLRKVETGAYVENKASQNMSKRLGFKLEGRKRKTIKCKATGKIHDEFVFGLLKEEWKKARSRIINRLKDYDKKS